MGRSLKRTIAVTLGFIVPATLILVVGCKKQALPGDPVQPAAASAELITAGKTVYDRNGCSGCHSVGGMGGRTAPDLSRVGATQGRTPEWLVAHVRNPKDHNPQSRMPSFEGRISDQDLLALGAYLASLK